MIVGRIKPVFKPRLLHAAKVNVAGQKSIIEMPSTGKQGKNGELNHVFWVVVKYAKGEAWFPWRNESFLSLPSLKMV